MTSWILGAGFVVLAVVGLAVELTARLRKRPTAGELMGILVATRTGRLVVVALWVWVGWHFLAR
jgi:Family of unknown function (DUF6186)